MIRQFRVHFDQYIDPTLDLIEPSVEKRGRRRRDLLIKYKLLATFSL